ncbi:MAG: hypothetical protein B7Y12_04830, partial [Rhizobiales bacterium 24-66-13]
MASHRLIRTLALCGSLGLLALPASARSEYGYKDRIFEQKYVLPETLSDDELVMLRLLFMTIGTTAAQIDAFFGAELAQAMGGLCDTVVVLKTAVSAPPLSPAQDIIAKAAQSSPAPTSKPQRSGSSTDELCLGQTVLFKFAYADSLSTDRQLSDLAAATRRRFAASWIAPAELQRTDMQTAARRLSDVRSRVARLATVGVVVSAADGGAMQDTPVKQTLKQLTGDEPYTTIDRRLTEIEEEAVRSLQAREATRRQDELRRQEEDQKLWEARAQAASNAIALEDANARVARARRNVQVAEQQVQECSAAIHTYQARRMQGLPMATAQGPSGTLAGRPGGCANLLEGFRLERSKAQSWLDDAMAALRSAQKTASPSQAPPVGQPGEERCVEGGRCIIVERTV